MLGDGAVTEWPSCPSSVRGEKKTALFGNMQNLNCKQCLIRLIVPIGDDTKKASMNGHFTGENLRVFMRDGRRFELRPADESTTDQYSLLS